MTNPVDANSKPPFVPPNDTNASQPAETKPSQSIQNRINAVAGLLAKIEQRTEFTPANNEKFMKLAHEWSRLDAALNTTAADIDKIAGEVKYWGLEVEKLASSPSSSQAKGAAVEQKTAASAVLQELDINYGNKYLSGDQINAYLDLLKEKHPNFDFFGAADCVLSKSDTAYAQALNDKTVGLLLASHNIVDAKSDVTAKQAEFKAKTVMAFPINCGGNHWVTAVANTTTHKITYYDSLGNAKRPGLDARLENIKNFMAAARDEKPTDWMLNTKGQGPKQEDSYNCGLYLLNYIEDQLDKNRAQPPIEKYRESVGAALIKNYKVVDQRLELK